MAKFEYDIDYRKDYPSENIADEVIAFLKESDLKRKYFEDELKTEKQVRKKKNGKLTNKTVIRPSREDSLERLMDLTQQFASAEDVEETIITKIMVDKLRHCLTEIDEQELELVKAIFFDGFTERQLSKITGIPQKTINDRKKRILIKLKKLLEN